VVERRAVDVVGGPPGGAGVEPVGGQVPAPRPLGGFLGVVGGEVRHLAAGYRPPGRRAVAAGAAVQVPGQEERPVALVPGGPAVLCWPRGGPVAVMAVVQRGHDPVPERDLAGPGAAVPGHVCWGGGRDASGRVKRRRSPAGGGERLAAEAAVNRGHGPAGPLAYPRGVQGQRVRAGVDRHVVAAGARGHLGGVGPSWLARGPQPPGGGLQGDAAAGGGVAHGLADEGRPARGQGTRDLGGGAPRRGAGRCDGTGGRGGDAGGHGLAKGGEEAGTGERAKERLRAPPPPSLARWHPGHGGGPASAGGQVGSWTFTPGAGLPGGCAARHGPSETEPAKPPAGENS
jgi:hypothetical protein